IKGYGDLQIGNIHISRVYYVEGLGHNLFSVGQFCNSDLKVAFRKHTCFVQNLKGVDLRSGSSGSNLYTISMEEMMKSSPICLPSKPSKTKSCRGCLGAKGSDVANLATKKWIQGAYKLLRNERTRSQARKRRQQQVRQTSVESPNLEKPNNNQETFNPPIVTMADNRTMAQLLEAPTEGYEDAIVVPEINANNFEIKHGLLNLVQTKSMFLDLIKKTHMLTSLISTSSPSTMKVPELPEYVVKLMLFPIFPSREHPDLA
ncbi:hypothetical protein Tco_0951583, partial [Tanacetum coccineum]